MMPDTPRTMAIEGRLMGLRPVWPEDFPRLFDWFSDRDEAPLWTSQFRQITTFQEFMPQTEAWLRNSISLLQVDLDTGTVFGFARAYNLNLADGYAWVQAYTIPAYRMRRHGAESAILFARYLFEHFPIRKLCSEVFAFNETAVRLNEKIGFRFEGRLTDHTWYGDRYWDHLFYSLNRDDWGEVLRRYAFIAGVEDELGRRVQELQ